jgi:hypothetical protein
MRQGRCSRYSGTACRSTGRLRRAFFNTLSDYRYMSLSRVGGSTDRELLAWKVSGISAAMRAGCSPSVSTSIPKSASEKAQRANHSASSSSDPCAGGAKGTCTKYRGIFSRAGGQELRHQLGNYLPLGRRPVPWSEPFWSRSWRDADHLRLRREIAHQLGSFG